MSTLNSYKTRQRSVIEQVLSESETHVTVDTLLNLLVLRGESVGRTTVYRCLEKLVSEGKARKYIGASGDSACYQYIDNNHNCHEHFHLKCEGCGKLIHIECNHLSTLTEHIDEHHGFKVNPLKTVLYGICEDCLK